MGCDIHTIAEVFVDGEWVCVTEFGDPDNWGFESALNPPYSRRNYFLFGVLAGVRDRDSAIICRPRGVPDDASEKYKWLVNEWGSDGHSHSWFTLQEILDFDWTLSAPMYGVTPATEYLRWRTWRKREGYPPSEYAASVFGPKILTEQDVENVIDLAKGDTQSLHDKFQKGGEYVEVEWNEPYARACTEFWTITIPYFLRLAHLHGGNYEKVRMCFFFDN